MGFGNGYSSRTTRGGKSYNNQMTAHVWNAQSAERGQSNNGNFYFHGRALYSYGSHFVVGYMMPDGVAFLNADSYSVSTSGHQSDASAATNDRRTVRVAGLTEIADRLLSPIACFLDRVAERGATAAERRDIQALTRRKLRDHAAALAAEIYRPGAERFSYTYEPKFQSTPIPGEMEAGAYLAALVGLPAATWPKLKREAAKLAADKQAAEEKAERVRAEARALYLADLSPRRWREWIAELGAEWNDSALRLIGKDLKRSRGMMLRAKSGKLAATGRLAIVRARIKQVDSAVAEFQAHNERRKESKALRHALAIVRAWRDATPAARLAVQWANMRDLATVAERLTTAGRLAALKASAAELARLAHIGMTAIEAENARVRKLEAERQQLEESERIRLWLAGERVGRIYFDAETGGAALRVIGDTLETSHGASVPLAHAVKAFRFIKLCRERGESFHRNGRTIRVGHFQVDSISASGDFVAGCHSFTWPEVERVAKAAGVFDCPASAEAVESSAHAA